MYTIGYDFGDTFVKLGDLSFAIRLCTMENVFAPDPQAELSQETDRVSLKARRLIAAGGQLTVPGTIELVVRIGPDGRYIVHAGGSSEQAVKSMVLLVRGIDVAALTLRAGRRAALEETAWGKRWIKPLRYPDLGATMPLAFVEDASGGEWFVLSKDTRLRAKHFASFFDSISGQQTLALSHEHDAREGGHRIEMPAWHIGRAANRLSITLERCRDLEQHFRLVPYSKRTDVPAWLDEIKLVVNLHGEHWTGHVFNTFDQMAETLEWVGDRIDGRHVMAFLPAWDGRYYYDYPLYEPSERLGGREGLARLVGQAHRLGMKVTPMLGANGGNETFVEQLGLRDAVLRDIWGKEYRLDWVDWDYDLGTENNGLILNLGHPGYRQYMVERASRLVTDYGVDSIFLDITYYWENDPRYSPYEGTVAWAQEMRRRFPGLLLFGENSYDALWGVFPIFAEDRGPTGHAAALHRYARQTYYLAHPSPVTGSGGVHEGAWNYEGWKWNDPAMTIPTLSIVEDTIKEHAREAEQVIAAAKQWEFHEPPIAHADFP